jgi:ribonucleoside-diphosphate reductase alpha chain
MMSGIRVINRKGERENLDITKIQFYTSKAVAGLSGVEQSDLETSAMLQVRDGMQVKVLLLNNLRILGLLILILGIKGR